MCSQIPRPCYFYALSLSLPLSLFLSLLKDRRKMLKALLKGKRIWRAACKKIVKAFREIIKILSFAFLLSLAQLKLGKGRATAFQAPLMCIIYVFNKC